jgi:sugar O-acyltransferase (sialic acid O-acetyltransferase NeuD family)
MSKKVVLVGARIDGQAGVVLDTLQEIGGYTVIGFLDNTPGLEGKLINGIPVLGSSADIGTKKFDTDYFHVAIGDNVARATLYDKLKEHDYNVLTVIHPKAFVSTNAEVGEGSYIGPMAVVNRGCILKEAVIINSGAIIEHDNMIGKGAHMAPGVKTAGRVIVGDVAFVGVGSTILPDISIGSAAMIGAGSTVVKNVESQITVIGYAAKKHEKNIYTETKPDVEN